MPTIEENICWKDYNWSKNGNEWSKNWHSVEAQWLFFLYPRIKKFLLSKSTILEIAPGYGRWTQFLLKNCKKYIGIDLNENCTIHCKAKFFFNSKAKFYTNNGKSLEKIKDNSIDFCFSFDSLVHADDDAIEPYIKELSKKLKNGAFAFIHHSNFAQYCSNPKNKNLHWRSDKVDYLLVQNLCKKYNLSCVIQELIKWENDENYIDCITIIQKNTALTNNETIVIKNETLSFLQNYCKYLAEVYDYKTESDFISNNYSKFERLKLKYLIKFFNIQKKSTKTS